MYLIKYLTGFNYSINLMNLARNIFDPETNHVFYDVMLKEEKYGYKHYDSHIPPDIIREGFQLLESYTEDIRRWGKPALLLFGCNDALVKKSTERMRDGYIDDNILVKHVRNASHVTPCMDTPEQIEKLDVILEFFEQVHNRREYAPATIKNPAF